MLIDEQGYIPAEQLYSTVGRKVKGNRTPFPRANSVAKHPLVYYVEFKGEDGFWAYLIDGYNWDGCSCVHEWYIEDVEAQLDLVTEGDPS